MNLLIITVFFIIGCEKTENVNRQISKNNLIGAWVNLINEKDTLFVKDPVIKRTDTSTLLRKHEYAYSLTEGRIAIKYIGEYYIYTPESSFKIYFEDDKMKLTIENIDSYFPEYKGNVFRRIK